MDACNSIRSDRERAIIVITYSIIPVEDSLRAWLFTPLWLTIIVTSVSAIQWRVLRPYIPRSAG